MPPSTSTSTRWCPTPEQLMILEELYRRGLRTPNASQIQRITAHLAFYGRIQGKNVFYWFQNHKARDRQKLRKKLHQHLLHRALYPDPPAPPLDFFHLPPQGPEEVMMRQRDLPKDWSGRSDGHDSFMITEVGPTFPCCRSKPLQTLQLFPLTSPTAQTPASYSDDPPSLSEY